MVQYTTCQNIHKKSNNPANINYSKYNEYMTPNYVWDWIKDYIPKDKSIWESFYGDGNSGQYLKSLGFNVIHQDIDFFENDKGDIVVSNPPFSMVPKILKRLYDLDKPFILIMPCSKISTKYFKNTFKENLKDIKILIPPKRIHFLKLVDGKPVLFINIYRNLFLINILIFVPS
jgi:hypothetical protein